MERLFNSIIFILCLLNYTHSTDDKNGQSFFPDDILTPYKGHSRSKRSLRFVRDCQPVYFGNRTHEEFHASKNSGDPFVEVHNLFYEYDKGKQQVYGHYSVVDNPLRTFSILEPGNIGGCSQAIRATVADTSKQRDCVVAVNAGYFRTKTGHCLGNIFSDGRKVLDANGIQNANFGIRKDGTIVAGYLSDEMVISKDNPFIQLVSGVVWLVRNGENFVNVSKDIECKDLEETGSVETFVNVVAGRTAIGHDAKGRVVVVEIDGRTHHRGMNLYDFADYLIKLGVVNAINLDGGGSTTFVVNGTTTNYPSDECGQFICARKVSTIACFHEPDCIPRDCNKHGTCQNGVCECTEHWTGEKCDVMKCSQSQCSLHGTCTEDGCYCSPGWMGNACDKACPSGTYGVNCSSKCHCSNGGVCNSEKGCHCPPGFMGTLCEIECPIGRFGYNCTKICNCSKSCQCDTVTGHCSVHPSKHIATSHSWNNQTEWIKCLKSDKRILQTNMYNINAGKKSMEKEYRKLLYWFVGVVSLCAVSILANCVLIYMQCNARRRKTSRRLEEHEFLFASDEEL